MLKIKLITTDCCDKCENLKEIINSDTTLKEHFEILDAFENSDLVDSHGVKAAPSILKEEGGCVYAGDFTKEDLYKLIA